MLKIYLALGAFLLLVVGGFLARINYLEAKNEKQEQKIQWQAAALENEKLLNAKQAAIILDAEKRANQDKAEKEAIINESNKMRNCIADKSCGFVVRFKPVQVPVIAGSDAAASRSGIDGTTCRFGSDFNAWANDLLESIRLNKQKIKALQADVLARSDKNYCRIGE